MRSSLIYIVLGVLVMGAARGWGQVTPGDPTNDNLLMTAQKATTWVDGMSNVVMLQGPVKIDLDRTKMTADQAVIWLTPTKGSQLQDQEAQIALIGNISLNQQGQITQSGDRLFVRATVRGVIRVTAASRVVGSADNSELYKAAKAMKPLARTATGEEIDAWAPTPTTGPATQPATQPTRPREPVVFSGNHIETPTKSDGTPATPDGLVAIVVEGNVKLLQRRGESETIEMQADRVVLFTPLHSLKEINKDEKFQKIEQAIIAAYLEGDVRIVHTPGKKKAADQRMSANRVYYDFETDRAILTDAVLHTVEPIRDIPLVIRARTIRQLSLNEFQADKVRLTQSSFYTPSYDIGMKQAYIRQVDTGDPRYGTLTNFVGHDMTFDIFGKSFFYWPVVGGSFTDRGSTLRGIEVGSSSQFGFGTKFSLGLFELLGKIPPQDVDAQLNLDYFNERGAAVGLDGKYAGGFITETTKQPWAFEGKWESYVLDDHGVDDLGRKRLDVTPEQNLRYRLLWEHQHFFPDNWQVQLTGALISDATFQEEWFKNDFAKQRPLDTAIYIKHQENSEAFTFLYSIQPNDFVTTANLQQEQAEIERVPEVSYHRIGESIGESGLTFFSDNVVGGLRFQNSSTPLSVPDGADGGQGFRNIDSPGLPSYGTTGKPTRVTYRGDFREELDYPFSMGQFRVVPYVMGRYTWYSRSADVNESTDDRLFVGAGMRMTTAFWKVDDTAKSELFDIHRLRHVIEPELNLFTSAQTTSRDHLLQYDEPIDEINDITAVQIALHQRWQTKRGGPGRWRSVDFFSLNVEANFFMNKPPDSQLAPTAFRGLYFATEPEASLPRNSINSDAIWRVSDTTAILADAQYNIDNSTLASASIGLAAARDTRLAYFAGLRYIDSGEYAPLSAGGTFIPKDLHSVVLTGAVNYEISPKYTVAAKQSFDFGTSQKVLSNYSLIRHFDRWYASITFRVDYIGNQSGVFFNVWPEGLGTAASSSERLQEVFR